MPKFSNLMVNLITIMVLYAYIEYAIRTLVAQCSTGRVKKTPIEKDCDDSKY